MIVAETGHGKLRGAEIADGMLACTTPPAFAVTVAHGPFGISVISTSR